MKDLLWPLILLFIVAVVLRSELFFYLIYVVAGLQIAARLWMGRGARQLTWQRHAPAAGFPGERLTVTIELRNQGLLPLPWLALHESLPPALHSPPMVRAVLSLGAGERRTLSYTLVSRRRGYYRLGPLSLQTGDVLGLGERVLAGQAPDALTIYPPVLPLEQLGLPATLPFGTLPASRRLFSDPARPAGVRPYQPSDGVRRIDWKASARAGAPQVRRYQPAIALETLVALAFSREEYGSRYAYDTMERALTAAASIAAHLAARRQPVGLCTTGRDPAAEDRVAPIVPVAGGRAHLMAVLGVLGRLELSERGDLPAVIRRAAAHLGWGSTVVVVTGQRGAALLAELLPLKRAGLNLALIIAEAAPEDLGLPRRHGIAAFALSREGRPALR
ncbi:MAG TPA: DUF58 domain-containing protein [Roseiflexaceae bacterium]|nr:DUF58 domain-containing protein [Roseiflexaceae bacterium]